MTSRIRKRKDQGFTLVELMIVVGLIGVLAAIAIPSFVTYQARSRRSEAYTNLASLARAYKSYGAESGVYPDMFTRAGEVMLPAMLPTGTAKMAWDNPTKTFFEIVGWTTEGAVYYAYDVTAEPSPSCTCSYCFTLTAYGDVDGDGGYGGVKYVHPSRDSNGAPIAACDSGALPWGNPVGPNGAIFDEVAIYDIGVDQF